MGRLQPPNTLAHLFVGSRSSILFRSKCQVIAVKRSIERLAEAGEDLIQKAIDAQRDLRQAEADGAPPEEIELFRAVADLRYRLVTEHQLIIRGEAPHILH